MSNRKHSFRTGDDYRLKCKKCGKSGYDLFTEYFANGGKKGCSTEVTISYLNKIMPCLTDEEVIIKRLLE